MKFSLKPILAAGLLAAMHITPVFAEMTAPMGDVLPFTEENWVLIGGAKFEMHDGQSAVSLGIKEDGAPFGFGAAVAKTAPFANGIIDYDLWFNETITFGGLQFHVQDPENYEDFYMRAHLSGKPDSSQYFPKHNGVAAWQLYTGERWAAAAKFKHGEWMHVRLAVSDGMADIYIRDMETPVNTVELMRPDTTGGLGLWGLNVSGPVWLANFAVKPLDKAAIKGTPTPKTEGTEGTVARWQVSGAFDSASLKGKTTLTAADLDAMTFTPMQAEPDGLVNLAELQGVSQGADATYARLTINADKSGIKEFEFGFSDIATVFLNGEILFQGADLYHSRDYRFLGTIGYFDKLYLNLKEGENDLVIAISEDIYNPTGWGVMGRFTDMNGISVK